MPLVSKNFSDIITFTRASSATFVGSNGLIQSTPQSKNLLTWTEAFDNAAWTKTIDGGITVSANTIVAPDGTLTADKFIPNAVAGFHAAQQTYVFPNTAHSFSFYAKAGEYSAVQIFDSLTTDFVNFNLLTGQVGSSSGYTGAITSVGDGWYRCTGTKTFAAGSTAIRIGVVTSSTAVRGESFTGNGTNGAFIWGAQLEVGSTATDYTKNDGGLFPPRFDYDPVTLAAKGLLIEEQRTNLLTYSEQFDNAAWSKVNATVTADASVAPDGTTTADKLIANTTLDQHRCDQTPSSTAVAQTFSVYVKAAGYGFVGLRLNLTGALFDLSTGATSNVSAGITAQSTSVGNGWYRCSITKATGVANDVCRINISDGSAVAPNFTGNGTDGIFIWGAQLEAGAFATSYIPTVASQVTRSADVASVNTLSPWYNATEGTLYAEVTQLGEAAASTRSVTFVSLDNNSVSNAISIVCGFSIPQQRQFVVVDGGVTQAGVTTTNITNPTSIQKYAATYKTNDFAFTRDALTPITDTSGTVPVVNRLLLGAGISVSTTLSGHLRRITYYPRRLSNAELQAITA